MKATLHIPVEIFHYDGSDESRDAVTAAITDAGGIYLFLPRRKTYIQFWQGKYADSSEDLILKPGEYLVYDDAGHFYHTLTNWTADELTEVGFTVV